uniref:Uncharacterized protein n=1 Tax=Plectus sambesii TaxID=2011161 RepID=A0A914WD08_9BILA
MIKFLRDVRSCINFCCYYMGQPHLCTTITFHPDIYKCLMYDCEDENDCATKTNETGQLAYPNFPTTTTPYIPTTTMTTTTTTTSTTTTTTVKPTTKRTTAQSTTIEATTSTANTTVATTTAEIATTTETTTTQANVTEMNTTTSSTASSVSSSTSTESLPTSGTPNSSATETIAMENTTSSTITPTNLRGNVNGHGNCRSSRDRSIEHKPMEYDYRIDDYRRRSRDNIQLFHFNVN